MPDASAAGRSPSSIDSARRGATDLSLRLEAMKQKVSSANGSSATAAAVAGGTAVAAEDDKSNRSCNVEACMMVLTISQILTPLDTQAPTPLLPVLITIDLNESVHVVGGVFASVTFASLVSFAMLQPLTKCMSPKKILMFDFSLRFLSGLVYCAALFVVGGTKYTIRLLYASRLLYGLTLNSFAIPNAWVGVRLQQAKRPAAIASMSAMLGMGITLGPVMGAMIASILPTTWSGYQATGYFTLLESAFMFVMVVRHFDDDTLFPQAPKPSDASEVSQQDAEAARTIQFIIHAAAICSCLWMMGAMAGFETLMGLALYHSYGLNSRRSWIGFLPIGLVTLTAFVLLPKLTYSVSRPRLALGCLLLLSLNLFGIHYSDLRTPVSLPVFYLGVLGLGPFQVLYVIIQTVVSIRVPRTQQVAATSYFQFMSQLGRGVGPIAGAWFYDLFTGWYGLPSGVSAAAGYQALLLAVGAAFPFSRFHAYFGEWSERSQAAIDAETATAMA